MKHFAKWFMDLKIASKFMICYCAMLILFLFLGDVTYQQFQNLTSSKVQQMSVETTRSVSNNLDFLFDTVNNQSMILFSNQTIQSALEQSDQYNFTQQTKVCNYLADFMNFNNTISSIYIFDRHGMEYYVDSTSFKNMSMEKIRQESWYNQLVARNGGYLLKLNGGGTFLVPGENYISMFRIINSINTQKPIGLLVVNIAADSILKNITQRNNSYDMQISMKDEFGGSILDTTLANEKGYYNSVEKIPSGGSAILNIKGGNYIVSTLINRYGWGVTSITPFQELTKQVVTTNITLIASILILGLMFLATFIFISLLITKPIRKLAISMKSVEKGDFNEINMKTGNDEIGHLKDVYNMMVHRISILIDDIIREQTIKREKELEVLQMQIKPHFLYNSFDAIASLALSGKNNEVFRLVQSLGRYYKGFLSACDEAITVGKELEITENYITIQKIRFPDKFTVIEKIDPEAIKFKMPSLTLQPLVENAINHGIRGKTGPGTLTVSASVIDNSVRLTVEDDGTGMEDAMITEVLEGRSKGVGMRATMEKLNLYFNTNHIFEIQSQKGKGTKISITIPINREANNGI